MARRPPFRVSIRDGWGGGGGEVTRVMQVMAGAPQGGAEMQFLRMALAFQRAGLTQRVVMRPHPQLLKPLAEAAVEVLPRAFGGRLDFKTPRQLGQAIDAF